MKLTPIVVLVDDYTLAWVEAAAAKALDLTPLADVMAANGWTADALAAGALLRSAVREFVPNMAMPGILRGTA